MNSALWIGAVTGLAGALVGGVISYAVSRQQIRDARSQRLEKQRADQARRREQRRFDIYAKFLTRARRFHNAAQPPYHPRAGLRIPVPEMDALARSTDATGSRVLLVTESARTETACRTVMRTIRQTIRVIHEHEDDPDGVPWDSLHEGWTKVLSNFRSAARTELGVDMPDPGAEPSDP